MATEEDCAALGGIYLGDGESCEPNPCGPTPTIESSWGRVKVRFQEMVRGVR
ncbi:MAG: hypothetical protein R3E12_18460 [Candidatus Eisenbacteria bacterium]